MTTRGTGPSTSAGGGGAGPRRPRRVGAGWRCTTSSGMTAIRSAARYAPAASTRCPADTRSGSPRSLTSAAASRSRRRPCAAHRWTAAAGPPPPATYAGNAARPRCASSPPRTSREPCRSCGSACGHRACASAVVRAELDVQLSRAVVALTHEPKRRQHPNLAPTTSSRARPPLPDLQPTLDRRTPIADITNEPHKRQPVATRLGIDPRPRHAHEGRHLLSRQLGVPPFRWTRCPPKRGNCTGLTRPATALPRLRLPRGCPGSGRLRRCVPTSPSSADRSCAPHARGCRPAHRFPPCAGASARALLPRTESAPHGTRDACARRRRRWTGRPQRLGIRVPVRDLRCPRRDVA
jgi:hypothetical protein